MDDELLEFKSEYLTSLRNFLMSEDDHHLAYAYELGRKSLDRGVGILSILEIHQAACEQVGAKSDDSDLMLQRERMKSRFLMDALGAFEMAYSGYRDLVGQLEAKLQARTCQLTRINGELEAFSYSVSHDLQEPLRMVASFAELLEKKHRASLDDDSKKYLYYVVDGAKRMKEMLNGLLTYSRLGKTTPERVPVDCGDLLREVLDNLQVAIRETGAELRIGDMPSIMADRLQLVRLFQNLISNALKFKGDKAPVIEISALRRSGSWQFSVKDNGIGIDPRSWDRVFQMFQQLHARGQYDGHGIGLSLVRKIVERHGGDIRVNSEPGRGSEFLFTIPDRTVEVDGQG